MHIFKTQIVDKGGQSVDLAPEVAAVVAVPQLTLADEAAGKHMLTAAAPAPPPEATADEDEDVAPEYDAPEDNDE